MISLLGMLFSFIGMYLSLIGRSEEVKFHTYKKKGRALKESKQLTKAMRYYKRAIKFAKGDTQESEIWYLIIHIHTDRQIAAVEQWQNCTGYMLEWKFGANCIPTNYERPPIEELLK